MQGRIEIGSGDVLGLLEKIELDFAHGNPDRFKTLIDFSKDHIQIVRRDLYTEVLDHSASFNSINEAKRTRTITFLEFETERRQIDGNVLRLLSAMSELLSERMAA